MKTRLQITVDDHFAGLITNALRQQAKHEKGLSKVLHLFLAQQIEQEVTAYQNEQMVHLGLHEIAAALEGKQ